MLHHYFGKGAFYYIFFEKGHNKTIRGISLKWVIQVFFFLIVIQVMEQCLSPNAIFSDLINILN